MVPDLVDSPYLLKLPPLPMGKCGQMLYPKPNPLKLPLLLILRDGQLRCLTLMKIFHSLSNIWIQVERYYGIELLLPEDGKIELLMTLEVKSIGLPDISELPLQNKINQISMETNVLIVLMVSNLYLNLPRIDSQIPITNLLYVLWDQLSVRFKNYKNSLPLLVELIISFTKENI